MKTKRKTAAEAWRQADKLTRETMVQILKLISEQPGISKRQIQKIMNDRWGVELSTVSYWSILKNLESWGIIRRTKSLELYLHFNDDALPDFNAFYGAREIWLKRLAGSRRDKLILEAQAQQSAIVNRGRFR